MENNNRNQKRQSRIDRMFEKANGFNEEIPMELAKKISVYSEILWLLAIYIARANNNYGQAVTARKAEHGLALTQETGTAKEKEGKAELRITKFRKREFHNESELIRWKHSFIAMQEMINAKKKELEVLLIEWGGKGHGG